MWMYYYCIQFYIINTVNTVNKTIIKDPNHSILVFTHRQMKNLKQPKEIYYFIKIINNEYIIYKIIKIWNFI